MKILQSWLKDYIAFDLSPEELADKLAMSGTAVEDILYGLDEKVIVAEILKIEPHPNADRLRLTTVETGTGSKIVVCGAPNIEVGQKVPLAQLGTILPGGEIKKANIRGVDSEGMLCAADELGIGEDHAGVYVLPSDYINGKPLREYLSSDAVFDLEITPNRGDCLSHLGIAREIAAILDKKTIQAEHKWPKEETIKCPFELEVKLEADEICTRYYGIGIMGVTVKNAPDFIASRLEKLGSKSINNIVDITNYLLLAIGQPMHAFDANKIEGGKIIVRFAKEGEEVVTLDNVKRSLVSTDLVIADTKKVIAVAGVMGCKNSEVDQQTKNIFLEVAEFDPRSVRKTAKRLSLQTDASYRYERGIDRAAISEAQNLAVPMIIESAGGKYTSGVVFINGTRPYEELPIKIEYQKINRLLGIDLSENKIELLLQRVGFKTNDGIGYIPTWRNDISIWQDLAEEVGRIYDYSNIQPLSLPKTTAPVKSAYYQKAYIKSLLTGLGFNEVINYPFMSEADLAAAQVEAKDLVELANPIQIENKYLRKSLAPGLLKAIAKNPSFDPVTIFEIGEVFGSKNEITNISIATSGKGAQKIIKNVQTVLAEKLAISSDIFEIRELAREDLQRFKIKKPVTFIIEANLTHILDQLKIEDSKLELEAKIKTTSYRPVSKYPSLTRDLAFIVDNDSKADEIKQQIYDISPLISRVELFDEFASDKFGQNKKNIAFHIYLQHLDRTLTDLEANQVIEKIVEMVETKFSAKLRK